MEEVIVTEICKQEKRGNLPDGRPLMLFGETLAILANGIPIYVNENVVCEVTKFPEIEYKNKFKHLTHNK